MSNDGTNGKPVDGKSSVGGRRRLVYVLFGVILGVPACCGVGLFGLWVINKPDPIPGEWSGREVADNRPEAWPWKDGTEIKLNLHVENGENTGSYFSRVANINAPPGTSFPIKWKVDGRMLEMEIIGEGTFWTGEQKARFTHTIVEELAGYRMKLVPVAPNKNPVTFFKSKPRPFPT